MFVVLSVISDLYQPDDPNKFGGRGNCTRKQVVGSSSTESSLCLFFYKLLGLHTEYFVLLIYNAYGKLKF